MLLGLYLHGKPKSPIPEMPTIPIPIPLSLAASPLRGSRRHQNRFMFEMGRDPLAPMSMEPNPWKGPLPASSAPNPWNLSAGGAVK